MKTAVKYPVHVVVQRADYEGECTITTEPRIDDAVSFMLVNAAGVRIATCESGKALGKYAFDSGAGSVAYRYDLGLEPDR